MAKQCLRNLYLVVLIVVLAACAVTLGQPTPTRGRAVECECKGTARAWIDENADGVWDEGEAPLSDVEIKAYGGNVWLKMPNVTDARGRVSLYMGYWPVYDMSCTDFLEREQVEVRAETPSGYRATTASGISLPAHTLSSTALQFGFVPIDLIETATPLYEP